VPGPGVINDVVFGNLNLSWKGPHLAAFELLHYEF